MNKNQFKLDCWIKLKEYFVNDFKESTCRGLCFFILRQKSYLFSEEEVEYLISEINDDIPMGVSYLFPVNEYEPRLSYIEDKIKKYKKY